MLRKQSGDESKKSEQPKDEPASYTALDGEVISVTFGPMTFTPKKFASFTVGAVTMTRKLAEGEDVLLAVDALQKECEAAFKQIYLSTRDAYARFYADAARALG